MKILVVLLIALFLVPTAGSRGKADIIYDQSTGSVTGCGYNPSAPVEFYFGWYVDGNIKSHPISTEVETTTDENGCVSLTYVAGGHTGFVQVFGIQDNKNGHPQVKAAVDIWLS